ncbi:cytochrome P450 [Nonomuraea fuscirosea]|jgi:cytochrome P450|uniref:cytochrome P450 n=1 Tax=Nonomuraea fuscirosea TaxID=1291556 RepID=UPI002DD87963|nr:cytochrome P450 [Nonomuraea fuscirosea]WSA52153.1 cytochrome P450 [Nonomuraea fuscirosea]
MTMRYMPDAGRLYGPEYARDPQAVYAELRKRHGAVAPVEIAPGIEAHLVIGYQAALDVLTNVGGVWIKNGTAWQARVPDTPEAAGPVAMLGYRPNALMSDGAEHARFRKVISDCFDLVQPHKLRQTVIEVSDSLISQFAAKGEADLVGEFAKPIPGRIFNALFGRPDSDSAGLIQALSDMMEADGETGKQGSDAFSRYIGELVQSKHAQRGDDLTSWFIDHPAALQPNELAETLVLVMAAAYEPTANLISNTISRMVSDDRYYSSLTNGALGTYDALMEALRAEPAMSNYGPYFVRQPVHFHGTWIQPAELVLVSYAAANTEPTNVPEELRSDGGAYLGFGAGPHRCPASDPAMIIAMTAIERLTSHLCDLELTVPREELSWRPGPFHRALAHLPVRFTPIRPDQPGESPWAVQPPSSSTPSAPTYQGRSGDYATSAPWSS